MLTFGCCINEHRYKIQFEGQQVLQQAAVRIAGPACLQSLGVVLAASVAPKHQEAVQAIESAS